MKHKPIICIDVDGVLRDLFGAMIDLYNWKFGKKKCVEEIDDYHIKNIFPELAYDLGEEGAKDWFFKEHSLDIFRDANILNKKIPEKIKQLREVANIIIVTYQQHLDNKIHTLEWLNKNDIQYDSIIFAEDKSLIRADWFIDDFTHNIENCQAVNKCIIDAEYNKDCKNKFVNHFENFIECANYILKNYGK